MSFPRLRHRASLRAMAAALTLAAGALITSPAAAQGTDGPKQEEERPGALAREAIEKLMRALTLAIENLPQYALPEINENGDIIIRRIHPRAEKPRTPPRDFPDGTQT